MMFNYPYSRYFYNNNYYRYNNNMQNKKNNNMPVELPKKIQEENKENNDNRSINLHKKDDDCIDILGIKLHFDDILLMLIIYFLYSEGIKDNYLFFVLVLLLLT